MAVLNIPTFGDVRIAAANEASDRHGDFDRSESGKARSDSVGEVSTWNMTTAEYSLSDARTIQGILLGTPPISVSGDAIGGTFNVHPRRVRLGFGTDNSAVNAVVSFELHLTTPA